MMDDLVTGLENVVKETHPAHAITITAAKAALVVAEKYRDLSADCELYDMSIGEL